MEVSFVFLRNRIKQWKWIRLWKQGALVRLKSNILLILGSWQHAVSLIGGVQPRTKQTALKVRWTEHRKWSLLVNRKKSRYPGRPVFSSIRSWTNCCMFSAYKLLEKKTPPLFLGSLGMVSHFLATRLSSVPILHTKTFLKGVKRTE